MNREIHTIQLSRLLPDIRETFSRIPEQRDSDADAFGYPAADVLMAGLAMMFVQDPSMLEFQRRLQSRSGSNNLKSIFLVEEIPQVSQFRRILDPIDPEMIQEAFRPCVSRSDVTTNWFSYTETSKSGKVIYHNTWITDLKPTRKNIQEMVEVGRHRWQIENQVFNILKNHGHHLEHNFGHGKDNLAFIFVILNFLAYMLHQLIALGDRLFQRVQEYMGTRYRIWDDIRVLLRHFVWKTWETLLEHILDQDSETCLDSG